MSQIWTMKLNSHFINGRSNVQKISWERVTRKKDAVGFTWEEPKPAIYAADRDHQ